MKRQPFAPVPRPAVQRYGPGQEASAYEAGDFILTHGNAWTSKLIRFGKRLRIHGADRKYTHWNHAAILCSNGGDLIEALGAGVRRTHISKYRPAEYYVVCTGASPKDRKQAVNWPSGRRGRTDR